MLRELGPENPALDGRMCFVASVLFLLCGLGYRRIADQIQRRTGQSDKVKSLGIVIMRPLVFAMSIVALVLSFNFLSVR